MSDTRQSTSSVLCWPKRLLSADDLRRHLTGQRELSLLPRTIVTPLAADELRAKGVRITWDATPSTQAAQAPSQAKSTWIYAQEKPDAAIASAIQAMRHDGIALTALDGASESPRWIRTVAETMLSAGHQGAIVFCGDPALLSCIANKISGLRALPAFSVPQVARGKKNLAANLFAIEMPGRTFFELRQMLRTIVAGDASCPEAIAEVLKELDGHAHR